MPGKRHQTIAVQDRSGGVAGFGCHPETGQMETLTDALGKIRRQIDAAATRLEETAKTSMATSELAQHKKILAMYHAGLGRETNRPVFEELHRRTDYLLNQTRDRQEAARQMRQEANNLHYLQESR